MAGFYCILLLAIQLPASQTDGLQRVLSAMKAHLDIHVEMRKSLSSVSLVRSSPSVRTIAATPSCKSMPFSRAVEVCYARLSIFSTILQKKAGEARFHAS